MTVTINHVTDLSIMTVNLLCVPGKAKIIQRDMPSVRDLCNDVKIEEGRSDVELKRLYFLAGVCVCVDVE